MFIRKSNINTNRVQILPRFKFKFLYSTKCSHKVYISKITDPAYNTFIEKWLINDISPNKKILYIWRNAESVFIGRNQNPYKECSLSNMEKDQVILFRRESGGGAVYHDLGNMNFSFIGEIEKSDRIENFNIIINSLRKYGINAEIKGRNDLVIDDKKISGSAYKNHKQLSIHHGTLLLNINTKNMAKYINPNKKKLKSKAVSSVEARVTNLINICPNICHDDLTNTIADIFLSQSQNSDKIIIDNEYVDFLNHFYGDFFDNCYDKFMNYTWIYGANTELFEFCIDTYFSWAMIEVNIQSEKGMIKNIVIDSDSLYPDMIDLMTKCLVNKRFDSHGINEAYNMFCKKWSIQSTLGTYEKDKCIEYMDEFCMWFKFQI